LRNVPARQAVQAVFPETGLNSPAGQAAHDRSLVTVAAAVIIKPAEHGLLTGVHGSVLGVVEKLVPTMHGSHTWLLLLEPIVAMPWPTEHALQSEQAVLPAAALN
jgi:hypothetical protein